MDLTHNSMCHICTQTQRVRLPKASVMWVQIKVPLKFISMLNSHHSGLVLLFCLLFKQISPNAIIWSWISLLCVRVLACDHKGRAGVRHHAEFATLKLIKLNPRISSVFFCVYEREKNEHIPCVHVCHQQKALCCHRGL